MLESKFRHDMAREFLTRLRNVRPSTGRDNYMASCPIASKHKHGDKNPSLWITIREDRLLTKCKSCGADHADILEAVGYAYGDFYDEPVYLSPVEKKARDEERNRWEHQRELDRQAELRVKHGRAIRIWQPASENHVTSHPYAIKKDITSPAGARRTKASGHIIGQDADCLVIPAFDVSQSALCGVQLINAEGAKQSFGDFVNRTLLLGNRLNKFIPWYVAEGWATAYSVVFHHNHGNACCAVSFGKSGLDRTAELVARCYQPKEVIVLGEIDGSN